jgi:heptaprenylglyceryl phosphate synthase
MRKIETQMNAAIQGNANWSSGNTAVYFDAESGVSVVRLHGNKIAEVSDDTMTIFDGGFQSTTTKSRLNALCDEFCVTGEGVFQKDFKWFVRKFVGQAGTSKVYNADEFVNGYVFA